MVSLALSVTVKMILLPLTLYASTGAYVTPLTETISCSAVAGKKAALLRCRAYVSVALAVIPSSFINSPVRGCVPIYGIIQPPVLCCLQLPILGLLGSLYW